MTHPVATTVIKNPSWWRRRTQLERVLTLVTVFTAGLCAVLVAALALTSYRQTHPSVWWQMADPADVLPGEALEELWACLPPPDLLSCRLVSLAWRDLLDHSRVWRRHLPSSHPSTGPWAAYRRHAGVSAAWLRAAFRLRAAPRTGLAHYKVAVGDDHIYILDGEKVLRYDKRLEVEEWRLGGRGVGVGAGGGTVGTVAQDQAGKYLLEVRGGLELSCGAAGRLVAVGPNGQVVLYQSRVGQLAAVDKVRREILPSLPGQLSALAVTQAHYAALTLHPASRGAGFTVHCLPRSGEGPWREVHLVENHSPLAVLSGTLSATDRALVVTRHTWIEGREETQSTLLEDAGGRWCGPGLVALFPRGAQDQVAVTGDGSVCYSRRGAPRYVLRLGCPLSGARLAQDFLLLWNTENLYTLTVRQPEDDVCPLDLEWADSSGQSDHGFHKSISTERHG